MVGREVVRHDVGARTHVRLEDGLEVLGGDAIDAKGAHPASALDQRKDRRLVLRATATLPLKLAAHVRLIGLHDALELAAQWLAPHSLSNPHRHEPGRAVGDAERAVELVATHTLL